MSNKELAKTYNPAEVEDRIYADWVENEYFKAVPDETKEPSALCI